MSTLSHFNAINEWYKKPIGAALLKAELTGLVNVLPQIFGYYIMQIGGPTTNEILAASPINNRIIVNPDATIASISDTLSIKCQPDELPFLPESIDAIVMFHVFEFAKNPSAIIKEIYTTLMPNGYVIILGFNPCSLWGLASLWHKTNETPWLGNWISPGQMRHLLSKADFTIGDYKTFYFRPPMSNPEKLLFLEGIGQIFWPYGGASYMLVAQKTIAGITPIKPILKNRYFKAVKLQQRAQFNATKVNLCRNFH